MTTAETLLVSAQKAFTAWKAFEPNLVAYQKTNGFEDFSSLGFPGMTPDGASVVLGDLVKGLEEASPILELDPLFGATAQEINSDDKFGQFSAAFVLEDGNQYGQFKAAIPKLREIRSILVRNGYSWVVSPSQSVSADSEKAIQRVLQLLKKQGKEAGEVVSRTKVLSDETEAIFSTVKNQLAGIQSTFEAMTEQQVKLKQTVEAIAEAGVIAETHLKNVTEMKVNVEGVAGEVNLIGPEVLSSLKAARLSAGEIADQLNKFRSDAEAATAAATASAERAAASKSEVEVVMAAITSTKEQVSTASTEITTLGETAKKAASEVLEMASKMPTQFAEVEGLRAKAVEVVTKAEHAWDLANRRGLAKAFDDAAKDYRWGTITWSAVFGLAVAAVCWLALEKTIPLVADGKFIDARSLILTLLSGPILWGAWIASREISKNGQMRDEYRYKASVALALEGYKREAGEVDPALVLKLMQGAVHHFSENPAVRVHKSNAPATPFHDAIERFIHRKGDGHLAEVASEVSDGIRQSAPAIAKIVSQLGTSTPEKLAEIANSVQSSVSNKA